MREGRRRPSLQHQRAHRRVHGLTAMREGRRRPSLFADGDRYYGATGHRNEGGAPAPLVGAGRVCFERTDYDRNEGGAPAPLVVVWWPECWPPSSDRNEGGAPAPLVGPGRSR